MFYLSARQPCDAPYAYFTSQFNISHSLTDKVSYNEADLILLVTGKQFDPLLFFLIPQASAIPIVQPTTATRVFHLSGSRRVLLQNPIRHNFFLFFSPPPSFTPGPTDCHKSNGSSYIMDELDVQQPTYMATSDPNLSKLSSYLTSSS